LREAKAEAKSEEKSRTRIQELEAKARGLGRESDRLLAAPAPGGRPAALTPGSTVYVRDLGVTATVVEGPDAEGRVVLERGAWRPAWSNSSARSWRCARSGRRGRACARSTTRRRRRSR